MVNPDFLVKWKKGPPSTAIVLRMTMLLERVNQVRTIDVPQKEVTRQLKTLGRENQDWRTGTGWFRPGPRPNQISASAFMLRRALVPLGLLNEILTSKCIVVTLGKIFVTPNSYT